MGMLNLTCDIERPVVSQTATKATKYDWTTPTVVKSGLVCAIQNAGPADIEYWERRGVQISTVVYFVAPFPDAKLGDRVKDARYSPIKYYQIHSISDMGGTGVWGKLYCSEII